MSQHMLAADDETAIVKEIVELHGGTISAWSAEGVTAFTVALPKT